ncbi:tetraspanin-31 [Molothrus ater]|uniref:tetraspanin-31 n=2 Tax=Molothrus TaxID=84832 RepID=UPI0023E8BBFA|nr:tetraspanin-31 [Molothrus ater]
MRSTENARCTVGVVIPIYGVLGRGLNATSRRGLRAGLWRRWARWAGRGPCAGAVRAGARGAGPRFKGAAARGARNSPGPPGTSGIPELPVSPGAPRDSREPPEPAMVCGGFACSRNALCALNVVYVLVGVLLVAVAGWARGLAGGSSPPLLGGAFAVGVFLLLIAALGLLGALRHHQVLLFFYVLILGLVFLCQLGVSCACLALGPEAQERLLRSAWPLLSAGARGQLQLRLGCCGLGAPPGTPPPALEPPWEPPNCPARCRFPPGGAPPCPPCAPQLLQHSEQALRILGGVGLFFSFTEVLGVWLALRFRNQRDPRANPGAFL